MPIVVPIEFSTILDAADHSAAAIDELDLASQLLRALDKDRKLNDDER